MTPLTIDLSSVQTTVLQVIASLIIIVLAFRVGSAWIQRGWGLIIAEVAMVLVVGYFVWFPDSAISALKGVVQTVTGAA